VTFSDDAKAVLVLTTRLGNRSRPSLSVGAWHRLHGALGDAGLAPADVFNPDFSAAPPAGVDAEGIRILLSDTAAVFVELDVLTSKGIWVLTIVDAEYPDRLRMLGEAAPPVLFGVGESNLLRGSGLGVVGSRNVEVEGARVAQSVSESATDWGLTLISGGARGVDQLAMNAAFSAGGSAVGVLADSLEQWIRKAETLSALDAGKTCLVVQQHPSLGFSPQTAMARNKLVYALADLTAVIATDEGGGGTWAGATEALRRHYGRVAVWRGVGEGPGNAALERMGAAAFRSLDELEAILDHGSQPLPEQLKMM
jgi:predicted Rossmann fold nucleotide-binding protein DprA/Smf involved in DNA uptake